ncbi:MAG: signal peptidase I [Clostridia bacterium]|nr:signal peptidase I [Clostridia bacterium]
MKKIVSIIVLIILIPILFVNGVILINSFIHPDEIPSFFGWKPFIVLSGSMETEIYAGDLAVVKEQDTSTLKKGDIIAFKSNDIVITHRIYDIIQEEGQTKYITKGDNNNTEDNGYVLPEQIEGIFKFRVSRLGNLAMFVQTPAGMVSCLSVPFILLILIQIVDSRREKKYMQEKGDKQKSMEEEIARLRKENEELMKK